MGTRIQKNITPQLDPDGIAIGQTLSGGGVQNFNLNGILSLNGTFMVIDSAHIIEISSTGDDSLLTFIVTGTDSRDVSISESISGTNANTASTTKHFNKVTQISSSGDTAANVEIGISGLCVSPWVTFMQEKRINIGLFITLSTGASLIYTVEHTSDDIQQLADVVFDTFPQSDLNSKTVSDDGNYSGPATAYRLNINSFSSGTVKFQSWQAY